MSKARPSRTKENAGVATAQAESHTDSRRRAGWSRWTILLIIMALVLVTWKVIPSVVGDADNTGRVGPIATLDAPDVHSLLVDPQDPEHILFGSHAGIQESRDGGFSWQASDLRNVDAMSMAVSAKAVETLYVAGHDVFQVSRDGGKSWQPQAHNLPGTDIHSFAQDPVDPSRLFAFVAGAGTFTSANGGTIWEPVPTQPPGGAMHVVLATSAEAVFAATSDGLLASRDQGASWQPLPAQPSGQVVSLAISASDPQALYVGSSSNLQKSTDGGATWTTIGPDDVPVYALAVTPTDPGRILFISGEGDVYRSDDGGATWRS